MTGALVVVTCCNLKEVHAMISCYPWLLLYEAYHAFIEQNLMK